MRLRRRNIWQRAVMMFITAIALWACNKKEDINETQQSYIVKFLEGSHKPKLIAESMVGSSIDLYPPFYTVIGQAAYRYISTYYDAGRESREQITPSSRVTLTYELYPTNNGSVSSNTLPTSTNNPTFLPLLDKEGLNPTYWNFAPLEVTIGSHKLLPSIEESLVGCRKGDVVEIYLTCNMAYGDDVIGMVEKNSALLFVCVIDSVTN